MKLYKLSRDGIAFSFCRYFIKIIYKKKYPVVGSASSCEVLSMWFHQKDIAYSP